MRDARFLKHSAVPKGVKGEPNKRRRRQRRKRKKVLQIVIFCPCHGNVGEGFAIPKCTKWVSDEWHGVTKKVAYQDKRAAQHEFNNPPEGIEFYKDKIKGGPAVKWYNPKTGKYTGPEDHNISVTGSHTICSSCAEERRVKRECNRSDKEAS